MISEEIVDMHSRDPYLWVPEILSWLVRRLFGIR